MKDKHAGGMSPGKRVLWTLLFLVIAALTIWAVTAQNKDFSLQQLWLGVFLMNHGCRLHQELQNSLT